MSAVPVVTVALPTERISALGLAFGNASTDERDQRCQRLTAMIERGELAPESLLVARREGNLTGAMLAQILPGYTAVVMPPRASDPDCEDCLVRFAIDYLKQQNTKLAQCFLDPTDVATAEPLLRHGFSHVTRIDSYLRVAALEERVTESLTLTFNRIEQHTERAYEQFGEVLLSTYTQSLDVPESFLELPASEVLAGFAHGRNQKHWWLVSMPDGNIAGVLMMAPTERPSVGELVYLGVVPDHRAKGYGKVILDYAIATFDKLGIKDIFVNVDQRNMPAIRMYENRGFRLYQSQEVYLQRF